MTTKARQRQPSKEGDREARIQHVESLMREFKFERGKTAKRLAKEWGVTLRTVHGITAEASKRIAAAVMDPDTVNAKVGEAMSQIIDKSMATGRYREAIEAAKAWAHIAGSGAPSRHEVTGKDGAPVCGPIIFVPPEDHGEESNRQGDSQA